MNAGLLRWPRVFVSVDWGSAHPQHILMYTLKEKFLDLRANSAIFVYMKRFAGEKASEYAYRVLREQILEFEVEPGEVIAEVETATKIGVSRTPLREAIAKLQGDGLLITEGARGVAVAPLTAEDVTQLTEVREALESQSARLAAQRRDPAVFVALAAQFAHLAISLPGPNGPNADREVTYELAAQLDAAIDEAAANTALSAAAAQVRVRLARVRRLAKDHPARLAEAAWEHRAIAEAIAWGDAELAGSAIRIHLRRSLEHALHRLEARAPHTTTRPHQKASA